MDERRATVRDWVLKPGTIEFGGGAGSCMVRNVSTIGAAMDTLVADGSHRTCQIIWRKRKRIGVELDQKCFAIFL
jgi:hypothetical protein